MSMDETPGQKLQWYFILHASQCRLENDLLFVPIFVRILH